jgi:putative heme transporter
MEVAQVHREDAMAKATSAPPHPGSAAQTRHRRVKAAAQVAAIGAITAGTGFAVYAERATVAHGLRAFTHANLGWVAAGFAAESLSMAAFALLQRRLLLPAGVRVTFGSLMGVVYTSTAISLAVPVVGSGLATAYTHRRLQATGADRADASMVLLIAGLISTVAFAVVLGTGAVVSDNPAGSLAGLATSVLAVLAMGFLVVVLHWPQGRARLRGPAARVLRRVQRLTQWPRGDADTIATATLERLGAFSLPLSSILAAFASALVNWAADIACLAAAIAAIGSPVPWDKLVLVWSAGQAAASLSPTPYGIGLVDVALIIALHAARLGTPDAVAAVLYYRIITFKIGATLLWIGYTYLRNRVSPPARQRAAGPAGHRPQRGRPG